MEIIKKVTLYKHTTVLQIDSQQSSGLKIRNIILICLHFYSCWIRIKNPQHWFSRNSIWNFCLNTKSSEKLDSGQILWGKYIRYFYV